MTTLNHALWGATFGRTVGLPWEGAIAGSMPDLLSIPFLSYYYFKGFHGSKRVAKWLDHGPTKVPRWLMNWYSLLHNWIFSILLIFCFFLISPKFSLLGIAYFWHAVEDGFFHETFATKFLYPLWNGKIQFYSAAKHKWVQVVDLFIIFFINIIFFK